MIHMGGLKARCPSVVQTLLHRSRHGRSSLPHSDASVPGTTKWFPSGSIGVAETQFVFFRKKSKTWKPDPPMPLTHFCKWIGYLWNVLSLLSPSLHVLRVEVKGTISFFASTFEQLPSSPIRFGCSTVI